MRTWTIASMDGFAAELRDVMGEINHDAFIGHSNAPDSPSFYAYYRKMPPNEAEMITAYDNVPVESVFVGEVRPLAEEDSQ